MLPRARGLFSPRGKQQKRRHDVTGAHRGRRAIWQYLLGEKRRILSRPNLKAQQGGEELVCTSVLHLGRISKEQDNRASDRTRGYVGTIRVGQYTEYHLSGNPPTKQQECAKQSKAQTSRIGDKELGDVMDRKRVSRKR